MRFEWGYLFGMALQTVPEPRKVARDVFAVQLPRTALWQMLALMLVCMTFLGVIRSILFPVDPEFADALLAKPLVVGAVQAAASVITVFLIYYIGRMTGGTGSFPQAIKTVVWMQFVLLILELGSVFFLVIAPGFALLTGLFAVFMSFWILSHFIAEMHGFASPLSVFFGIVMTAISLSVLLSMLLALLGLGGTLEPVGV